MSESRRVVVNSKDVAEITYGQGAIAGAYKPLTPGMGKNRLGMNLSRLSKGQTTCPFHYHLREDEIFYVLSGRGVLRYGEELYDIGPGDCISCPAGTKTAHQIANPYEEDLIYLAAGPNDAHEVCVYPDTGKVLVRGISELGFIQKAEYFEKEPEIPRIFQMIARRDGIELAPGEVLPGEKNTDLTAAELKAVLEVASQDALIWLEVTAKGDPEFAATWEKTKNKPETLRAALVLKKKDLQDTLLNLSKPQVLRSTLAKFNKRLQNPEFVQAALAAGWPLPDRLKIS